MILGIMEAKIVIMCVIVKKITQIVVIGVLLMIVNWMMMHCFYFDDCGNIRYFTDRSKTGIT